MTHICIIQSRAQSLDDIFPEIDAKRWLWAAEVFEELGRPAAAERARAFAQEFRLTAATLRGERQVGDAA